MAFIIIVDDQATNRRIWTQLARELESDACVEAFDNPLPALDRIRERVPDLIITDFQMPEMNGADFIRSVREMPEGEEVPVIVVSVYEDRELRYEALEAGATDFLMSPVDHYEFRTRARNLLTLRAQQLLLRTKATNLEHELKSETARHAAAMRNSYERLEAVINSVPALIYAKDSSGMIILANRAAADFLNANTNIHVINGGKTVTGGLDDPVTLQQDQDLLSGEHKKIVFEEQLLDATGEEHTYLTTKSRLIDPDTNQPVILTVSLDISSRKKIELELAASRDAAESANRAKTEFLANMSHELRTPLNAVIGFSEIIASEYLGPLANPKYTEYASDIHKSSTHLLGVISDILDLARIEEGSAELTEAEIDVCELLTDLQRMLRSDSRSHNVELEVDQAVGGLRMMGDEQKIRQTILNVAANALKFSEEGSKVLMSTSLDQQKRICISIEDQGIGMTPEEIDIALSRFGQVFEGAQNKKYQGSGLGLPIAAGFAELHGGDFIVESQPGGGTKVQVRFPESRTILSSDRADGPAQSPTIPSAREAAGDGLPTARKA